MKTNLKNIALVIGAAAGLSALAWYVWYLLFADDANEGGFQFFKNQEQPMDKPQSVPSNVAIQDISATLPKSGTKKYPTRKLSAIQQVVVHHSATKSTAAGSNPTAYAQYHVSQRGWAGIGYHFVIQPDGTVYQTNRLEAIANHVQNANTKSVGICLSGNFDEEKPTALALGSLVWLIRYLNATLGKNLPIRAHNEFAPKSCPGAGISVKEVAAWVYEK